MSIFSASSTSAATPTSKRSGLTLLGVLAVVSLSSATGCVARVRSRAYVEPATVTYHASGPVVYEEEPTVYVSSVPADIEAYPRVYYRGSYAYYVDGRWYTPSPRGWVYYRAEPRALVTHRVDFERRYPRTVVRTEAHPHVQVETRGHVDARPRVQVETRGRVEAHPRVEVETRRRRR